MFTSDIIKLNQNCKIDTALKKIYEHVDLLMKRNHLDRLNREIYYVTITANTLDTDLLLGYLTATLPVKDKLDDRPGLFRKVKIILKKRGDYEQGILAGLK